MGGLLQVPLCLDAPTSVFQTVCPAGVGSLAAGAAAGAVAGAAVGDGAAVGVACAGAGAVGRAVGAGVGDGVCAAPQAESAATIKTPLMLFSKIDLKLNMLNQVYLKLFAVLAVAFASFSPLSGPATAFAAMADAPALALPADEAALTAASAITPTKTAPAAKPITATKPAPVGGFYAAPVPFAVTVRIPVEINIDSVYARNAPGWNAGLVQRLLKHHGYEAVARDTLGEWLLIVDGASRVWIHKDMAKISGDKDSLPVAEKAFSPGYLKSASVAGVPAMTARARQLYAAALKAGRAPNMATVVGDCNSEYMVFFGRLANGGTSLSASGQAGLSGVAARWGRSFYRASLATHGSFGAGTVLDATWADAKKCSPGENPVSCELRNSNASVVFLSLGTGDTFTWQNFETNYRAAIDTAIANRTLPILVTKADDLEFYQGGAPKGVINDTIRRLGAAYQLPVMDFAQATRALPEYGLMSEVVETPGGLRDMGAQRFHLNDAGLNLRIIMMLMTLRNVG